MAARACATSSGATTLDQIAGLGHDVLHPRKSRDGAGSGSRQQRFSGCRRGRPKRIKRAFEISVEDGKCSQACQRRCKPPRYHLLIGIFAVPSRDQSDESTCANHAQKGFSETMTKVKFETGRYFSASPPCQRPDLTSEEAPLW
jgi:hypothetical protein